MDHPKSLRIQRLISTFITASSGGCWGLGKIRRTEGGKARAKKLSARQRVAIAKFAASSRWGKGTEIGIHTCGTCGSTVEWFAHYTSTSALENYVALLHATTLLPGQDKSTSSGSISVTTSFGSLDAYS
jgi:hypothetical protein